ncbi:MAG: OsmC family protein [Planctomycetes bacterium]|nr:OsmC family protein [Planctomycetota bacterium]
MPTVSIRYENDLRCAATHEASTTTIHTDAPKDNQGLGRSFSPTDLVAAALGSCMATIMGIYARRHELDIEGMEVTVDKRMTDSPRRIGALETTITLPRPVPDRHREPLRRAAESCPVHKSLLAEIDKPIVFHFPEA